jgi:hypothetical protein
MMKKMTNNLLITNFFSRNINKILIRKQRLLKIETFERRFSTINNMSIHPNDNQNNNYIDEILDNKRGYMNNNNIQKKEKRNRVSFLRDGMFLTFYMRKVYI